MVKPKRKLTLTAAERKRRSVRQRRWINSPTGQVHLQRLNATAAERLAERNRRNWADPKYRAEQTARIRAMQPQFVDARREVKKRYWADPVKRRELSTRSLAQWKDPAFRKKFFAGWLRAFGDRNKPSQLHAKLKAAMLKAGIDGFATHVRLGHYCIDEADASLQLAIEINGCYWHACAACRTRPVTVKQQHQIAQDKRKRSYLYRRGWVVLTLWEHELAQLEQALKRIRTFIRTRR